MDSVANDNEQKLNGTLADLDKALANLSAYEAAFMAPRGKYEQATPDEIADAQRTSRECSPRRIAEQETAKATGARRQLINYRNYVIHYDQKPVPGFGDWSFSHNDFDGAPDAPDTSCGDHRCGYAETPKEAKAEIDAQYVDLELDEEGHYTRRGLIMQSGTHE
jgi:hypothetical protein